jgi:hypothetical protein
MANNQTRPQGRRVMATKLKTKKTLKRKASSKKAATAFEAKLKDGSAVVGIGNLHVVITRDGTQWFAQGLEIDYAAQGSSEKDVRKQFEQGLCSTIHEHLSRFGSIKGILQVAPQAVWKEMLFDNLATLRSYSQISSHHALTKKLPKEAEMFPFDQIQYLEPELVCA